MEVLHHIDLRLWLHLLHGVRHGLVVEGGEHPGAVGRGELVEDTGKVCGMELGESLVGHPQLDRRDGRLDRIDILPVDVSLGGRAVEGPNDRAERAFETQAAHEAGRPDIDRDQVQSPIDVVEPQVIDPDHLPPVDVHDLAVEQVLAQQDLVRALLEDADVDLSRVEHDAGLIERPDRRPGQEDAPACGVDDEAGDRRVAVTQSDDQIIHLADGLPLPIPDGPSHDTTQVVHLHLEADGLTRSVACRGTRADRRRRRSSRQSRGAPVARSRHCAWERLRCRSGRPDGALRRRRECSSPQCSAWRGDEATSQVAHLVPVPPPIYSRDAATGPTTRRSAELPRRSLLPGAPRASIPGHRMS